MRIDWTFDNCDEFDEMELERIWKLVQLELEGKLAELAVPASHLRMAVDKRDDRPRWVIDAALHTPGATVVARGRADARDEALNRVLGELAGKIDKLDEETVTVVRRREGVEGVVDLLDVWKTEGRSERYLFFLLPLIKSLRPYIHRELQLREFDESLPAACVSERDVADEVLLLAWERHDRRPSDLRFDLWLMRLADEALDRLCQASAADSLDASAAVRDEAREVQNEEWDEWIEQVAYREEEALRAVLPGESRIDAWDDADGPPRRSPIGEALRGLGREQRQALVLHVVYGHSLASVADFQDRPLASVDADVGEAISTVRRNLSEPQQLQIEEQLIRDERRRRR